MSTADLYTPDYPHGTPAGYRNGCRGSACPNRGDAELQTCKEANSRYLRDRHYQTLVNNGGTPLEQALKETGAALPPAPIKKRAFVAPTFNGAGTAKPRPGPNVAPAPTAAPIEPAVVTTPTPHPELVHGLDTDDKPRGYWKGCRCARCRAGAATYQRHGNAARKAARTATRTSGEEVSAPVTETTGTTTPAHDNEGTASRGPGATIRTPEPKPAEPTPPSSPEIPTENEVAEQPADVDEYEMELAAQLIPADLAAAQPAPPTFTEQIALHENEVGQLRKRLSDAEATNARHLYDYQQLWLENEQLRATRKIDTAIDSLTTALAEDIVVTGRGPDVPLEHTYQLSGPLAGAPLHLTLTINVTGR